MYTPRLMATVAILTALVLFSSLTRASEMCEGKGRVKIATINWLHSARSYEFRVENLEDEIRELDENGELPDIIASQEAWQIGCYWSDKSKCISLYDQFINFMEEFKGANFLTSRLETAGFYQFGNKTGVALSSDKFVPECRVASKKPDSCFTKNDKLGAPPDEPGKEEMGVALLASGKGAPESRRCDDKGCIVKLNMINDAWGARRGLMTGYFKTDVGIIAVINVHLKPYCRAEGKRKEQIERDLLVEVENVNKGRENDEGEIPVVIVGDFNAELHEKLDAGHCGNKLHEMKVLLGNGDKFSDVFSEAEQDNNKTYVPFKTGPNGNSLNDGARPRIFDFVLYKKSQLAVDSRGLWLKDHPVSDHYGKWGTFCAVKN